MIAKLSEKVQTCLCCKKSSYFSLTIFFHFSSFVYFFLLHLFQPDDTDETYAYDEEILHKMLQRASTPDPDPDNTTATLPSESAATPAVEQESTASVLLSLSETDVNPIWKHPSAPINASWPNVPKMVPHFSVGLSKKSTKF